MSPLEAVGSPQRDVFQQRLAEAIAWCAPIVVLRRPKWCLRTSPLEPRGTLAGAPPEGQGALVNDVRRERVQLLHRSGVASLPAPGNLAGRRPLLLYASDSLRDGSAEVASEGFLDADNQPPWDTWVHFFLEPSSTPDGTRSTVLGSWIPPAFIELVQDGIAENPEGCLAWASPANLPLLR